jgi:adenosine deaminase
MSRDADSDAFVSALEAQDLEQLRRIPKADVHNHMDLGGDFSRFCRLIGETPSPPPPAFETFSDFQRYILQHLDPILSTVTGTQSAKLNTIIGAGDDGVVVLEASIDDGFHYQFERNPETMIEFLRRSVTTHHPRLEFRPELGLGRTSEIGELERIVSFNLGLDYFRSIDLYGDEVGDDVSKYRAIFKRAKRAGLKCKAHVGEYGDAALIQDTIETLDLDEIQHGITATSSRPLMRWLRDRGVRLNLCPTSNLKLNRVATMADHPLKVLFHEGVRVSVNTDDRLIFGRSVSEEFLELHRAGVLSPRELDVVRMEGLRM